MISLEDKQETVFLISEAVESGARKSKACEIVEISLRTFQRWSFNCKSDQRKGSIKKISRKLSSEENQAIIDVSCHDRFKDLNPHEIVPILAEEGCYIASESTFYRVLRKKGLLNHRSNSKARSKKNKPSELKATGPNQVWSWDITYLKSEIAGIYYYCYMIKDIWSKKIVGWEIHGNERADLAADMFRSLELKYNLKGVRLHSDNGKPMKGATMIITLYNLGVIPSFSRPHVSTDNAYIESLFKTMKYTAGYPAVFRNIDHAKEWMSEFVSWYNTEHRHSSIDYITPEDRASGKDIEAYNKRNVTIEEAMKKNPERWGKRVRRWKRKDIIILNPDFKRDKKLKNVA